MSNLTDVAHKLHEKLVEALLARLESGEATPADLNVARQFLKDNGVDYLLTKQDTPMHKLAESLPFKDDKAHRRLAE